MSRSVRFGGRVALVTGGGDGIGRATALRLAEDGAAVGIATKDAAEAAAVAEACRAFGAPATAAVADLGDAAAVSRAHGEIVAALGPIDVLVNNVGIGLEAPFLASDDDLYERTFAVNFMAAVRLARLVLPAMIEKGSGSVINVASAQGLFGWPGFSAYSASKGALMSWSRQLANEFGAAGIRFNSVIPGSVLTPMNRARIAEGGEELRQRSINTHIIPRLQEPDEVAAAIAFLASDDASFITASELVADGGTLAKAHWYL